jgi:hypothetical protein
MYDIRTTQGAQRLLSSLSVSRIAPCALPECPEMHRRVRADDDGTRNGCLRLLRALRGGFSLASAAMTPPSESDVMNVWSFVM